MSEIDGTKTKFRIIENGFGKLEIDFYSPGRIRLTRGWHSATLLNKEGFSNFQKEYKTIEECYRVLTEYKAWKENKNKPIKLIKTIEI